MYTRRLMAAKPAVDWLLRRQSITAASHGHSGWAYVASAGAGSAFSRVWSMDKLWQGWQTFP